MSEVPITDRNIASRVEDKSSALGCGKLSSDEENNLDSGILSEIGSSEIDLHSNHSLPHTLKCERSSLSKWQEIESVGIDSGVISDELSDYSPDLDSENIADNRLESKFQIDTFAWNPIDFFSQRDEWGNTKLHEAIIRKDEDKVGILLQKITSSAFLDEQNDYYQTCLHLSVLGRMPKVTRLLFLAGARTDIQDIDGNIALHLACRINDPECVNALLKPLTNADHYTQFHCGFLYTPVPDYCRKYIDEHNYDGLSCLHIAAVSDNRKIMDQLLKYGANINIREFKGGYTILHIAVDSGDENLVNYILKHSKLNVNMRNYARKTAYQLSAVSSKIKRLLSEKGCVQSITDDSDSEEYDTDDSDDSDY